MKKCVNAPLPPLPTPQYCSFRTFKSQPWKHPKSLQELAEHHTGNWPHRHVRRDAVVRIPEETIRSGGRGGVGGGNNKREILHLQRTLEAEAATSTHGLSGTNILSLLADDNSLKSSPSSHLDQSGKCYLKQQTADQRTFPVRRFNNLQFLGR